MEDIAGGTDQFVTFRLGKEELGVPIHLVQEIIKPSQITRVPRAPVYIAGMSNLRGDILPVVNLRKRLGLDDKDSDEATRIIVLNVEGASIGITVDSVSEVLTIESNVLEAPPAMVAGIGGQCLSAMAKVDGGKRLVLILNEKGFLPEIPVQARTETTRRSHSETASLEARVQEAIEQLVTFEIEDEEYAIDIMHVKEIIKVPNIMPLPKAPDYVIGVMSLRGQLLPVVDLRKKFNYPGASSASASSDSARIVVVEWNGVRTGLRVDSVSQVLRLEVSAIEPPPVIVGNLDGNCLRGVGKLNGGKRLLMLLDMAAVMPSEALGRIHEGQTESQSMQETETKKAKIADEIQVVCFRVNNEEYGFDIMRVQEIIRLREVTGLPQTKKFVEGIINLRGNVIPVVDMRKRFDMATSERNEQNRVVIVNVEGRITGLLVDAVTEVLRINKDQVEAPPAAVSGVDGRFFDGIGKLNGGKRMIVLIKLESLLSDVNIAA